LALLGLLAGCGKPAGNAANTAATNAAPVDTVITAAQFPVMKVGYWEETKVDNGGAPQVEYRCERDNPLNLNMGSDCTTMTVKHLASGDYTVDVKCTESDGTTRNDHGVLHGDANSNFTLTTTETRTQPGEPTSTDTHRIDAHYAGPCPTD